MDVAGGRLPAPGTIQVPEMQEVAGVVTPEDLVLQADRFSSEHLPFAAGAAGAEVEG